MGGLGAPEMGLGVAEGSGGRLWVRAAAVACDALRPVPGSVTGHHLRSPSLRLLVWNMGLFPARTPGARGLHGIPHGERGDGRGREREPRTHLRRTSGTGRGSATHCRGPRRTRCRRTRTAAGWPTAAALSPWPRSSRARFPPGRRLRGSGAPPPGARRPAPARPGGGPAPPPRPLARFLIANLINGAPVGGARLVNG